MSILNNAIDSISIGIEDFNAIQNNKQRVLSCTRNIFSGILLLFKQKLIELSPKDSNESLIKQKILPQLQPDGSIIWVGVGEKTVDVQMIKERFKSLNINIDWKILDKLNHYRNNIEHYYDHNNLPIKSIQEMISHAFLIINSFIRDHLEENPENLFNHTIWMDLISIDEVYQEEKRVTLEQLKNLKYIDNEIFEMIKNYRCHKCGYSLLSTEQINEQAECSNFYCRSCNNKLSYDTIIKECIANKYTTDYHDKYGAEFPLANCPECGEECYIMEKHICFICGHEAIEVCQICGSDIESYDMICSPLCGHCSYLIDKDD